MIGWLIRASSSLDGKENGRDPTHSSQKNTTKTKNKPSGFSKIHPNPNPKNDPPHIFIYSYCLVCFVLRISSVAYFLLLLYQRFDSTSGQSGCRHLPSTVYRLSVGGEGQIYYQIVCDGQVPIQITTNTVDYHIQLLYYVVLLVHTRASIVYVVTNRSLVTPSRLRRLPSADPPATVNCPASVSIPLSRPRSPPPALQTEAQRSPAEQSVVEQLS